MGVYSMRGSFPDSIPARFRDLWSAVAANIRHQTSLRIDDCIVFFDAT